MFEELFILLDFLFIHSFTKYFLGSHLTFQQHECCWPLKTGPPFLFVTQLSPGLLLTPFLWQTGKPMTVGSWASPVPLSPLFLGTRIHTYSSNASRAQRTHIYILAWVFLSWTSRTRSAAACFSLQYLRVPQMRAHANILMRPNQVFCLTAPPLYLYFSLFLPPLSRFAPLVSLSLSSQMVCFLPSTILFNSRFSLY